MKKLTIWKLLLAAMLCVPLSVSAQVTIGSGRLPSPNALLDLDATDVKKGIHLPRLTETERDALVSETSSDADKTLNMGLTIFNKSCGCMETWTGEEWFNLCNGVYEAEMEIPACNRIRVYGEYSRNAPLNDQLYIILPVKVNKPGEYNLMGISNNGYFFQTSGTFADVGMFEIRLFGMGTPGIVRVDNLLITNYGEQLGTACDIPVNVRALEMAYKVDCDNVQVFGTYQTRQYMGFNNYVEIPVEVLEPGTTPTSIQTEVINGIRFYANKTFNTIGEDTIVMRSDGSPKQEGTFTYTFITDGAVKTTCSFKVNFISTLGTFEDPSCNCLEIYEERPFTPNGEYWLIDCKSAQADLGQATPLRTFCDIRGGGWTLMWSYSEYTARNTYIQSTATGGTGNSGRMLVYGGYWGVSQNREVNPITTQAGNDGGPTAHVIKYHNFRLNKDAWEHLPAGDKSLMKVRICESPTDMDDEWGLNNYAIIMPNTRANNPLFTNFGDYRVRVPAEGKVFGKKWSVSATGGGTDGGWDEISGNRNYMRLYNSAGFCTHWDFAEGWSNASTTPFQVIPNKGGAVNTTYMRRLNNLFGWFGETEVNHHFGKCGATGENYSFEPATCADSNLYPHSFNPVDISTTSTPNIQNQGRYLQWFVR